jgi:hypothetical protein
MLRLFHDLFPEVAERESRTAQIRSDIGDGEIPAGDYLFVESYCTDPDCDCQRVLLSVTERRLGIVATISYGFNPSNFPLGLNSPNPLLDPFNRQSKFAEDILALFKEVVLDEEYDERLKRHYRIVKWFFGSEGSSSSGRHERDVPSRSDESTRQKRKQQKAARRMNRRR